MTSPVLFGLLAAFSWGNADFIARFTGRAIGAQIALLGMLGVSALVLTTIVWGLDEPLQLDWSGGWVLLGSGMGMMVATLLFYQGLAKGPVTIVAPIVGSFPVFNVIISMLDGLYPSTIQLLLMIVVMAGVATVAACAPMSSNVNTRKGIQEQSSSWSRRLVVSISLLSAIGFAFTIHWAQQAIPIYGELQTIWLMRCIGFTALALLFLFPFFRQRRTPVRDSIRWLPLLALQGLLDGGGYLAVLFGSADIGAQIVVVIGSCFSAVTVILAKLFLHEEMTARQWLGIIAIVSGIAMLSWLG